MRINLKTLGLALVAAFAMSAVAASSASATGLGMLTSSDGGPVTLTGADDGVNSFTAFSSKVECPNSTYTGHKVLTHEQTTAGETHKFLPNKSTEVTVTPHYRQVDTAGTANCDVNGGEFSTTVNMNGCDYRFYDFTTTPAEAVGTYGFLVDIVCPPEKEIILRSFSGHGHLFEVCTTRIPAQTGLTGAHATNVAFEHQNKVITHTVTLTGTVKGIKATKSGFCGSGSTETAEYQLNVKIDGHNELGETVGTTISHTR